MNQDNRKELQRAISLIEEANEIVERIKEGEQEKFDNLSEGLQQSERGQKFEENVSILDDAFSQLEDSIENIQNAIE